MSFFEELKRRNVIRVAIAYGVASWFLLQLADLVLENIGAPAWVIQAIMLVLAIGFPLVVMFAWAFEMTPEGIKKEKDVDRSQSIANVTGRKLDRMIIGIMAVVIAFLVLDRFVLSEKGSGSISPDSTQQSETPLNGKLNLTPESPLVDVSPSIAVLPFVNMSGDKENEYFSDGLTETLLHMLAQLPELKVAARTSSFAFKGQNSNIEDIARTLGVAHVLEGSVQKVGNRVRITAQLIRAEDGFHVWSQNYDRTLDDIFAIQDEIANDVVGALDASLLGSSSLVLQGVDTNNTEAYDLYLKALEQQAIYSYTSIANAENLLKSTLVIDPDFADAKLALARNYQMKLGTGLIESEEAWRSVEPLLLQVESKRPGDPMVRALTLNSQIQQYLSTLNAEESGAVVDELRTLLPQFPGDTWVRMVVARNLMIYKKFDEALEVLQAGLMLDPLSAELHSELGNLYRRTDRYEEARASYLRAIELAPDGPNPYNRMGDLAKDTGDFKGALDWYRQSIEKDPQDHELAGNLASTLFRIGLTEEGKRWANRCYALAPQSSVCRRLQLEEARARNQDKRRLELAKAMLKDDVDTRAFSFTAALWSYRDLMIEEGRAREAFVFLLSLYPDLDHRDQPPQNLKSMLVRTSGTRLMMYFTPKEEFLAALNQLDGHLQAAEVPWLNSRGFRIEQHLSRGEIEQAKTIALNEDLNRSIADSAGVRFRYQTPLYQELSRDPEIAARLRERDEELAILRDEVKTMLLQPEWNQ